MPPPDFQLTPPFLNGGSYRPPRNMLGNFQLSLDPVILHSRQGWLGLPASGGPPKLLGYHLGNGLDDPLRNAMGKWSNAVVGKSDPKTLMDELLLYLDEDKRKAIAEALSDYLATPIYSDKTNIVTGEPIQIGKIGPDLTDPAFTMGKADPLVPHDKFKVTYNGVDSLVPSSFLSLHKNFKFSSAVDVKVSLLVDKDAVLAFTPGLMVSGASAEMSVKTSWSEDLKITIIGGRDESGGPAGGLMVGFRFR